MSPKRFSPKPGSRRPRASSRKSLDSLETAIALAVRAHAGQKDKAGVTYILHPLRVMLKQNDDKHRITAVLHDVVEDTDITLGRIRELFGSEVADAVDALTHRPEESQEDYLARVAANPVARKVKLADSTDNMDRLDHIPSPKREELRAKYENVIQRLAAR